MAQGRTGICGVALCPKCGGETQYPSPIGHASQEPVVSHGSYNYQCGDCKSEWKISIMFLDLTEAK